MENNLKKFVTESLLQIRNGVIEYNRNNEFYTADMPKQIDFDLAILNNKGDVELINNMDVEQKEVSRIRFSVNPKMRRLE